MKAKVWLISWLIIIASVLSILSSWVYNIDPFFHYHKPHTEKYFYTIDNARSQNYGIVKHFEYDTLISGSSMVENFRTTEADKIFECNSIKVAYSGGSYKEVNDTIEYALETNKELKTIIRCLDMSRFFDPWDKMRLELGDYPTYLYDKNPFNDVEYLLNRDVIFGRVYQMTLNQDREGFPPGITSFDDYSRWQSSYVFGINSIYPDGIVSVNAEQGHLSDSDKANIKKNIEYNVTNVVDKYPNVDFYYFYSPYSIAAWNEWKKSGNLYKMLEAEAFITELLVSHENIHLFSFNNRIDITTDLNNYKDGYHYATWINSLILKWMHNNEYRLTKNNYKKYLKQEYDFYTTFDYTSINGQEDYEADFFAAALLNKELTGAEPLNILNSNVKVILNSAEYFIDDNGNTIIDCHGTLSRDYMTDALTTYIRDKEFIGAKFNINLDAGYNYLCFDGQKIKDHGRLTVYVYDESGKVVGKLEENYPDLDNGLHRYVIDLSTISGNVTIVLNGGFIDYTGSNNSNYQFSNIYMY